jgi:hypothetical protein
MKFDGTNWLNVGNAGFSTGVVTYTSLAFSPTGQPYVVYADSANSKKATVMKFDSVFVGISEQPESRLFLYPNPVSTKLTINFEHIPSYIKWIEITDMRGMKMFETQTWERERVVNVENFPCGIYFVNVKSINSNYIGKFFKN